MNRDDIRCLIAQLEGDIAYAKQAGDDAYDFNYANYRLVELKERLAEEPAQ